VDEGGAPEASGAPPLRVGGMMPGTMTGMDMLVEGVPVEADT
jgi:hypothetical protein